MIQALRAKFECALGQAVAAAIGAGISLASLTGAASAEDLAANQDQAGTQTQEMTGKPVILRVGPGFSLSAADGIADVLNEEGCPTTVTTEQGVPLRIVVEVNGGEKKGLFSESGSAGASARDWCLEGTE